MIKWSHIILHHSLTEDGIAVNWQSIRRYHTLTLGWQDIGYHFGVEWIRAGHEILVGRPLNMVGAHTLGMNERAIGICIVGNYDVQYPTGLLIDKLVPFLGVLCEIFKIPVENIEGHRDYSTKSCPGKNFDLSLIRSKVREST